MDNISRLWFLKIEENYINYRCRCNDALYNLYFLRPIKLGSICAQWGTKKLTDADVFKGVAYENFMMISKVIRHWFLGSIIELSLCKPNSNKILLITKLLYSSYFVRNWAPTNAKRIGRQSFLICVEDQQIWFWQLVDYQCQKS